MMKDQRLSSPGGHVVIIPFTDNNATSIHGKRENQDGYLSPLMKARPDGNLQMDGLPGSELLWKNSLMQQQQHSELTGIDPRLQQRMSAQFVRSGFPRGQWRAQALDISNNPRKEDSCQKRKLVQSPHISAGGLPQSPLSSRSREFSTGSHQFGAVVSSGHLSQKEKYLVTPAAKRRSNSVPKTPAGVGSPVSVSTMSVPISASTPPFGSQALGDQSMLERFSKIEVVTIRCQLNCKKKKVEENPVRKPNVYSAQYLMSHLSSDVTSEILKDETYKLSKSLVAGSMNTCKTRILNFAQTERIIQGNSYQLVTKARARMIMSEKATDGNVAFHIGEIDDADYSAAEEYLPTLPNAHVADLIAAQFSSLLAREGYDVKDHLHRKPPA